MSPAMELNILWLWPDILNLHGDRGNVMALFRVCSLYGIKARLTRVSRLSDSFVPRSADIIVLGSGELAVMPEITGALLKRFPELIEYKESGGVLFCTGTTMAALSVFTMRLDGSYIYGLGLFDAECRERETVWGDDIIFKPSLSCNAGTNLPVFGIQIQMIDIRLREGQAPLGQTEYGYGNDGGVSEGAINVRMIHTNAHGPVLVKNPWLALSLVRKAVSRRYGNAAVTGLDFDPSLFRVELESAKAIDAFNDKKEKPK